VLLAHADELGLSDEQYAKLRELEDARELKVREAHPPNAPERRAGGMRGGMGGPPPGGGMGGPPGGGGMGGPPGGGGMGGARGGGPDRERMEARLDELDAQAWFLAEPFLTPAQRERGAKLAMAWRERVLAWRAAMKARE
jgi:hypothetical protein